jgi:hypothetical protein
MEMGHDQHQGLPLTDSPQQVQQAHRIHPSADAHDNNVVLLDHTVPPQGGAHCGQDPVLGLRMGWIIVHTRNASPIAPLKTDPSAARLLRPRTFWLKPLVSQRLAQGTSLDTPPVPKRSRFHLALGFRYAETASPAFFSFKKGAFV